MKKNLFRILVGLTAFGISVVAVWVAYSAFKFRNYSEKTPIPVSEIETPAQITSPNGKIEVRFVGYGVNESRPTLKFEITNYNSKTANYRSYQEKQPWVFVKFNGEEKDEFRCGTGLQKFSLKSGESFETEVIADFQIYEFLKKDGYFEFGFYFQTAENDSKQYWSEPITISKEMKEEIIKNAPKYLK